MRGGTRNWFTGYTSTDRSPRLEATSTPGVGSRFRVVLPVG